MQAHTSVEHWQNATDNLLFPLVKAKRLGLVVDMDGTISHIAETPEAAIVTPRNRELLGMLVLTLPLVAAISGRAVRDLQQRIAISGVVCVGNHGLEHWVDGKRVVDDSVRSYRRSIAAALDELRTKLTVGMWIEDKYATASVHYRMTPDPEKAKRELAPIMEDIAATYGLVTHPGHRLYELRPPIQENKGTALRKLVKTYDLDAVMYIGDDLTDIDAIKVAHDLRESKQCYGVGVGVISDGNENRLAVQEASDVIAHNVADVEALLQWLMSTLSKQKL